MFDWDSANISHIAAHDILPEEAEQSFQINSIAIERQIRNGEERTLYLGETKSGRILYVVMTQRGELFRVVTAYDANAKSRRYYAAQKGAAYGKDVGHT